jgi:hypothetical protein
MEEFQATEEAYDFSESTSKIKLYGTILCPFLWVIFACRDPDHRPN